MFKSWFGDTKNVTELIARRAYGRAAEALRAQLQEQKKDVRLRQQLADVLALDGKAKEALEILGELADEFAKGGEVAKAVAVLKKIQRMDPTRSDVDEKLTSMIKERDRQVIGAGPARPTMIAHASMSPVEGFDGETEELALDLEPIDLGPDMASGTIEASDVDASSAEAQPEQERSGLARAPLFSDFSDEELLVVIRGLELQTFEAGDIIFAQGQPGSSLYILANGVVKAFIRREDQRYEKVREMADGAFFGEIALLSGQARTATIVCATACELLELDRASLDAICETKPRVRQVLQEFAEERSRRSSAPKPEPAVAETEKNGSARGVIPTA